MKDSAGHVRLWTRTTSSCHFRKCVTEARSPSSAHRPSVEHRCPLAFVALSSQQFFILYFYVHYGYYNSFQSLFPD